MARFQNEESFSSHRNEINLIIDVSISDICKVVQRIEDLLEVTIDEVESKLSREYNRHVYETLFLDQTGLILPFSRSNNNRRRYPAMFGEFRTTNMAN